MFGSPLSEWSIPGNEALTMLTLQWRATLLRGRSYLLHRCQLLPPAYQSLHQRICAGYLPRSKMRINAQPPSEQKRKDLPTGFIIFNVSLNTRGSIKLTQLLVLQNAMGHLIDSWVGWDFTLLPETIRIRQTPNQCWIEDYLWLLHQTISLTAEYETTAVLVHIVLWPCSTCKDHGHTAQLSAQTPRICHILYLLVFRACFCYW